MRFRLMTYNMHKGIGGVDRRYRPERVIDTIAHYDPDIVLLQELDEGVPRSRRHRQVDLLGDALGYRHRVFQPNVTLRRGRYGNALLSRYSLTDIHHLDLTIRFKKRRRALIARCHVSFDHHTRTVLIANFHLGLAAFERRIQIRRFLSSSVLAHVQHRTPVIAAGDFNDVWDSHGKRLFEPEGFHLASRPLRTFPAIRPVRPLDGIYVRGDLNVLRCFTGRTRTARFASDHLPIVVDLELV